MSNKELVLGQTERLVFGPPVLEVDDVTVFNGAQEVLRNASFVLRKGESAAIVGPNGVGKTTLLKLIIGERLPDKGKVLLHKSVNGLSYIPQAIDDLALEVKKMTILEYFFHSKGLDNLRRQMNLFEKRFSSSSLVSQSQLNQYGKLQESFEKLGGWRIEAEARRILSGIGLSYMELSQKIESLSGGEKTKLFIAQALLSESDLLLMDEPTNHLDADSIQFLGDFLESYKGAVLVVSHRPEFLDRFADRVIELSLTDHTIRQYPGNYTRYLIQRNADAVRSEKENAKRERQISRYSEVIRRLRAGSKAKMAKDREKKLAKLEVGRVLIPSNNLLKISFETRTQSSREVMTVSGLKKSWGEQELDYTKIDLSLARGEKVGIVGPVGAGKSTYLKIIAGKLSAEAGEVKYGMNVKIGYYAQELDDLSKEKTVIEELRLQAGGLSESRMRAILGHFLFSGDTVYKQVKVLSFGERSRLALAKLVVGDYNFLVLDEPTNHLDKDSRRKVGEALSEYNGTLLVVSHDEVFLEQIGLNRIILLPEGKIELV